jgi:DNA modification methylase
LLRPIIGCASNPGDLVIDPFCGSATTGVAAIELGRSFIGIEANPRFVERARQRIARVTWN